MESGASATDACCSSWGAGAAVSSALGASVAAAEEAAAWLELLSPQAVREASIITARVAAARRFQSFVFIMVPLFFRFDLRTGGTNSPFAS